ncbi:hypothetical protein BUALT_BualtUnG0017300 [Buddleja alternifolia]|uniref:Uncharacterized protein n=1 Tax=Buddleja alternifolia TaxID=168488 RepID=A0AAV6W7R1_9LAMI|nr:hypothetical protein BUALT_BualtUnG0017300 [Buddleja alternifolia]
MPRVKLCHRNPTQKIRRNSTANPPPVVTLYCDWTASAPDLATASQPPTKSDAYAPSSTLITITSLPPEAAAAPPPAAKHADHPRSSSPTISLGSSSSSQSLNDSPPQRSRPGKCVDFDALTALNIRDEYIELVDGIGWSGYFYVKLPAFVELTREFYTTMGIVTLNHGRATFTSPRPTLQPKKQKHRDMEESPRDTISSTPETSDMPFFYRHFEDCLNHIGSKLDRILTHFHIPPD